MKSLYKFINSVETTLGRHKLLTGPIHAQIEPTNRCNQDCVMCSRREMLKTVEEGDMSLDQFKRILDQLPHLMDIQINGLGEPLMNPLTPQFIRLARERNISVSMNTNAAFITESKAEELLDSGLNLLKVSMDSADDNLYQSIRVASLTPVLKGLHRMMEARKKHSSHPLKIGFNTVIQKDNRDHLLPIAKLADELEVDFIRFKVVGLFDLWDPNDLGVAADDIPSIATQLVNDIEKSHLKTPNNLKDLIAFPERLFRNHAVHPCYSPFTEVYVQVYGGIRLCCEFYDPQSDVGNLYEEEFSEIWNGEKMQKIRRRYWKGDTFFPNCSGCNRFYPNELKFEKISKIRKPYEKLLPNSLPTISHR